MAHMQTNKMLKRCISLLRRGRYPRRKRTMMIESSSQPPLAHHSNFKLALLSLPGQYLKVLIHPSVNTFVYEKSRGSWGLVWFQLFMLSGISALLAVLASLLAPPDVNAIARSSGIPPQTLHIIL